MSAGVNVLEAFLRKHSLSVNQYEVLKDVHTAELFDISLRKLRDVRRRNRSCFPIDFAFVIGKKGRAETWVFTLQGLLMVSALLKSGRAISLNRQLVEFLLEKRSGFRLLPKPEN
jgi:hypothetical protein